MLYSEELLEALFCVARAVQVEQSPGQLVDGLRQTVAVVEVT